MTGSHGPEGDEILLNGNVRITRGRTVLTADHGRYVREAGMLYLDDDVEVEDSTSTLTCDHAEYSEKDDVVKLSGSVTLVDREATLEAPSAVYDRRTGRADLFGGVSGTDKERTLTCDHAVYFRDSLLLQARGNVKGRDEDNKLDLEGQSVDYDRSTHEAVATGDPLMRVTDEKGHAAVIRALSCRLNTETRVAEAIDSVRVERDTLQRAGGLRAVRRPRPARVAARSPEGRGTTRPR